jgi:hypothetical protein
MEVAKADLVLGNRKANLRTSRAAPSDAAVQSSKRAQRVVEGGGSDALGVIVATGYDNDDKEAGAPDEGYIVATGHDFKRRAW